MARTIDVMGLPEVVPSPDPGRPGSVVYLKDWGGASFTVLFSEDQAVALMAGLSEVTS